MSYIDYLECFQVFMYRRTISEGKFFCKILPLNYIEFLNILSLYLSI